MPEYYNVLKPVAANAAFAMQGYRSHADTYYVWLRRLHLPEYL